METLLTIHEGYRGSDGVTGVGDGPAHCTQERHGGVAGDINDEVIEVVALRNGWRVVELSAIARYTGGRNRHHDPWCRPPWVQFPPVVFGLLYVPQQQQVPWPRLSSPPGLLCPALFHPHLILYSLCYGQDTAVILSEDMLLHRPTIYPQYVRQVDPF